LEPGFSQSSEKKAYSRKTSGKKLTLGKLQEEKAYLTAKVSSTCPTPFCLNEKENRYSKPFSRGNRNLAYNACFSRSP